MKMRPKRSLKREIDTFFGETRSNEDRKGMMATKLANCGRMCYGKEDKVIANPHNIRGLRSGRRKIYLIIN